MTFLMRKKLQASHASNPCCHRSWRMQADETSPLAFWARAEDEEGGGLRRHLSRHLLQLRPIKVQAANHVPLVLQQPHRVPRAEVHVVEEDHAVRRPHGLALGAPAGQAPRCQPPVCNLPETAPLLRLHCQAVVPRSRVRCPSDSHVVSLQHEQRISSAFVAHGGQASKRQHSQPRYKSAAELLPGLATSSQHLFNQWAVHPKLLRSEVLSICSQPSQLPIGLQNHWNCLGVWLSSDFTTPVCLKPRCKCYSLVYLGVMGQQQAGGRSHAVVEPQGLQSPVPRLRQEVYPRLILCSCQAPSCGNQGTAQPDGSSRSRYLKTRLHVKIADSQTIQHQLWLMQQCLLTEAAHL